MIIDIHVHPQFVEPEQTNGLLRQEMKLDIVASPASLPMALEQTSRHYYQRIWHTRVFTIAQPVGGQGNDGVIRASRPRSA